MGIKMSEDEYQKVSFRILEIATKMHNPTGIEMFSHFELVDELKGLVNQLDSHNEAEYEEIRDGYERQGEQRMGA